MVTFNRSNLVETFNGMAWWIRLHRSRVLIATVGLFVAVCAMWAGWQILWPQPNVSPDYAPFADVKEYEAFMAQHPLMSRSAPDGASFNIRGQVTVDKRAEYTVDLFAPALKPDNPESMKNYLAALKQSQQQALDWIKSTGEPMDGLYIAWSPNPDVLGAGQERVPLPQKSRPANPSPTVSASPAPTGSGSPRPTSAFPH